VKNEDLKRLIENKGADKEIKQEIENIYQKLFEF